MRRSGKAPLYWKPTGCQDTGERHRWGKRWKAQVVGVSEEDIGLLVVKKIKNYSQITFVADPIK